MWPFRKRPVEPLELHLECLNVEYHEIIEQSSIKTGNSHVDTVRATYQKVDTSRDAVIMMHGFGMDRSSFAPYGEWFTDQGISVLHLELPHHGERGINGRGFQSRFASVEEIARALEQAESDVFKMREFLLGAGHKRVSLAGYSLGATLALTLYGRNDHAFERIFAAFGGGDIAGLISYSTVADEVRGELGIYETPEAKREAYKTLDRALRQHQPYRFARYIREPKRIMMVNGINDFVVPPENTGAFQDGLQESPDSHWLDARHYDPKIASFAMDFSRQLADH